LSRSKHTVPPRIRAVRRVRAPEEPRGCGDPSAQHTLAREMKELGLVIDAVAGTSPLLPHPVGGSAPCPLPRVRVTRPRHGYHHPANQADITRLLRFFGEVCTYGLRSVELVQDQDAPGQSRWLFGRLVVPGRILIYDQPPSPWLLRGKLPAREEARLRGAGAVVEAFEEGLHTVVTWPDNTLRDFMLFEVLMHEIGHHILQQYRGKRPMRIARTRDHEAFAENFSRRCREIYDDSERQTS
jgi:hypothetical protein